MYFNGLLLLSAQFVRIATNDMLVITNGTVFVSAHRVQIATVDETGRCYVYRLCLSAPRADRNKSRLHPTSRASLCLSAPRADRNRGSSPISRTTSALSQRTACRSQPPRSQIWLCTPFFVSPQRLPIATGHNLMQGRDRAFVSAHRVQIATANVHKAPRVDLRNAL